MSKSKFLCRALIANQCLANSTGRGDVDAEVTCVPPNIAGYLNLCESSDPSAAVPLS